MIHERLLQSTIDFSFRNPLALKVVLQVDDSRVFALLRDRLPFKLVPFRRALFTRAFAHFIEGEEIALLAASGLARMAQDDRSRRFLRNQVCDELRHRDHFRLRLAAFGLYRPELAARQLSPHFRAMRRLIEGRLAAGDFSAVVLGNNLMLEGLALNLIAAACPDLRANSHEIAQFLDVVIPDEKMHVGFGSYMLPRLVADGTADPAALLDFYHRFQFHLLASLEDLGEVMESMSIDVPVLSRRMTDFYEAQLGAAGLSWAAAPETRGARMRPPVSSLPAGTMLRPTSESGGVRDPRLLAAEH